MSGSQFLRFFVIGLGGFLVDVGVLLLATPALGPYWGRLLSFTIAVIFTWLFNRSFTFESTQEQPRAFTEFIQYLLAMSLGGAVNYSVYAALVFYSDFVLQWPVIGVAVGSAVGLGVNFTLAKNWVFKPKS